MNDGPILNPGMTQLRAFAVTDAILRMRAENPGFHVLSGPAMIQAVEEDPTLDRKSWGWPSPTPGDDSAVSSVTKFRDPHSLPEQKCPTNGIPKPFESEQGRVASRVPQT